MYGLVPSASLSDPQNTHLTKKTPPGVYLFAFKRVIASLTYGFPIAEYFYHYNLIISRVKTFALEEGYNPAQSFTNIASPNILWKLGQTNCKVCFRTKLFKLTKLAQSHADKWETLRARHHEILISSSGIIAL